VFLKDPTGPFLAAGWDLADTVQRLRSSMVERGRWAHKVFRQDPGVRKCFSGLMLCK
jgi:hypothetical protein